MEVRVIMNFLWTTYQAALKARECIIKAQHDFHAYSRRREAQRKKPEASIFEIVEGMTKVVRCMIVSS